ncbi:Cupin 2, conserved barrel domain protein [Desulforamulus reducens MI-1]|uniref:Cupin 2, conserved barrel domain protein n=1 Tax=Desulforamulus reducens (strain ATCC BAA-1160 / DSM 100696 / MI-1) TaxID=349161 RepID=A4J4T3_DESRM|nr:Cupin 2, conserved barrel domain protein [Desulforamulus reducens MI-1]
MEEIFEKVRTLRNQKNMTLKDLSEKTGLSVSFLSQVERGTSSLAITSLKKIADALNVHIASFFANYSNTNFTTRADEQKSFKIEGSSTEYIRLSGEFHGRNLEPLLVTFAPGQVQPNTFCHPGEEFYYVLEGAVIFNVDGKEILVKEGDTIHFPSTLPHFWINPLQQKTKVLCVLTPVIF